MRALLAAFAAAALLAVLAPAALAQPRVVVAFLPVDEDPPEDQEVAPPSILERLDRRPTLALGLIGATQGRYEQAQALLDITQGTRTSAAAYDEAEAPELELFSEGGGALFQGWLEVNDRADSAQADIRPGLLAESIPGGAAYAGVFGRAQVEAIVAADRAGRVGAVSLGLAEDLAGRARDLLDEHRLVVAGLPTGEPGFAVLDELIRQRERDELLLVMQTPPDFRSPQLLPGALLGNGVPGALTSPTTRLDGVVAGIDLLPTILRHLAIEVPDVVKGQPIQIVGNRDAAALQRLDDRLRVVSPRRFPALETVLAIWLTVLLVLAIFADRRGVRRAMRLGALAFLWILPVLLLTAALAPSRGAELAILGGGTFLLAALTDRFLSWPRGPLLPCAVAVVTYIADLARGSDLIIQSILGPNPRFGSRYYGIGNELEATLPILLFLALAAALQGRPRSRGSALAFALCGAMLGAAVGWGKMGADVGGVITIGAGTAVATLFLLPGGITKRAVVLAALVPGLALAALAALDLLTGGNGHFTRTVLQAESGEALQDVVARRYRLAFNVLKRGLMPFATLIAALTVIYGLKYRGRLYDGLGGDPAWTAALAGALAGSVAGALFNDSGPVLLLFGAFMLAIATVYLRGDPRLADPSAERGFPVPGPTVGAGTMP